MSIYRYVHIKLVLKKPGWSDPLELQLQMFVNGQMWVLRTDLLSSAETAHIPDLVTTEPWLQPLCPALYMDSGGGTMVLTLARQALS